MLTRKNLSRLTAAEPVVPVTHRIQQVLVSAGAPGSFAARHTAGIDGQQNSRERRRAGNLRTTIATIVAFEIFLVDGATGRAAT
jgi:hypothetical protein